MNRVVKGFGLAIVAIGALVVILFASLLVDFSGHAKDRVLKKAVSPDGQFVAEVHEVITPMHGGPDRVDVTLQDQRSDQLVQAVVYSRIFECGPDYAGYGLRWQSSQSLTIWYPTCDGGRYRSPADNWVLQKLDMWRGVAIVYHNSGYVAHATR
jgi:hypothetical protein